MRILKYDFNYGRRELMQKAAIGASAGLLMPLSKVMASAGDIGKAYPDELLSIDMYTKGKIKTGDILTADNVDVVKELLDPMIYDQVKTMGRKIKIKATQRDYSALFPGEFYQKTLANMHGNANGRFDANGNVVTQDGKPWNGGMPFPDPKSGNEVQANMAMSWGRGDYNQYAIRETDISPEGAVSYNYEFVWAELQAQARMDGKVFKNMNDLLRFQTVFFTSSQDVAGSSFLSTWYYDQRRFPELYGYLPQFKRVRQFPTNQRFEPLIPGVTWFLSDPWAAGDPMLTWGDYKILERKPMLGAFNTTWSADRPNWEKPVHGGPKGITFYDTEFELAPEVVVLESKPNGYPRAPVGRRVAWVDVRNCIYCGDMRYDRNNKPWVNFETGFGQYKSGDKVVYGADGKTPAWSWIYVMSYDCQNKRMSRAAHAESCFGGYKSVFRADNEEMYNKFFTQQAIQRLGQV
jgi:hypothetical protein